MRRSSLQGDQMNRQPMSFVAPNNRQDIREKDLEGRSMNSMSSNMLDFVRECEVWENQSWRPVRRIWSSPLGVPKYANRDNDALTRPEEKWDELTLDEGWEWVSDIQVDKSGRYGATDEEGWMYGISFESLVEKIKKGQSSEQSSSSVVRRRRFVRSKKCVAPSLIKSFQDKFSYFKQEIQKLKMEVRSKQKNQSSIEMFEKRRVQAYQWSSTLAANRSIELVSIFKEFLDKLLQLKQLLDERLAIESEYAKKMSTWSNKWKSRSVVKAGEDDCESEETPGLFCILGSTGGIIAEGVNSLVDKMSDNLTSDVDLLIRELNAAVDTGTRGASNLWAQLKEKESKVSKNFMVYKRRYKMGLDSVTRDIMTLTDCFARADSVGHLLVDDLLGAVTSCNGKYPCSDANDFFSSVFSFSFLSDTDSPEKDSASLEDYYESYQTYCGSVVDAKSILVDLEALVALLGSNADSIASRSAAVVKSASSIMTDDLATIMHGVSCRLKRIGERLMVMYETDKERRRMNPEEHGGAVVTVEEAAKVATIEEVEKHAADDNGDGLEDLSEKDDDLGVIDEGSSTKSPSKSKKIIYAGDTDLFRSHQDDSSIGEYGENDMTGGVDTIPEEERQEAAELDFSALDKEGEFNLDMLPPLLSIVSKAEILRSCTAAELEKSAMTRWNTVALVMTEVKMYIHRVTDEQVATLSDISNCQEVYRLIIGQSASTSLSIKDIDASVLLHPVYSDAFEVTSRSSGEKVIFLTKGTKSTTEWLDALAPMTPSQDSAVMFSSTEI